MTDYLEFQEPCLFCGEMTSLKNEGFCSSFCESNYLEASRPTFEEVKNGIRRIDQDLDLPTVDEVMQNGVSAYQNRQNIVKNLLAKQKQRQEARIAMWEEGRRINGI